MKAETHNDEFDAWYYDECGIAAAGLVGTNGYEYDGLHIRLYEDDARRAAALTQYHAIKD